LPYRIVYSADIREHGRSLSARQRSMVLDSIDEQLTHEPTIETQNRKEMRPNPLASWELRSGDLRVYRVYYDVAEDPQTVTVVAIGIKRGNRVFIGGREVNL
jgi:mRNA interferase RelE/StbE